MCPLNVALRTCGHADVFLSSEIAGCDSEIVIQQVLLYVLIFLMSVSVKSAYLKTV
jgi:hypothetical protein